MNGNPYPKVAALLAAGRRSTRRRARATCAAVLSGVLISSMLTVTPAQAAPAPDAPAGQRLTGQVEPLDAVGAPAKGVAWPVKAAESVERPAPVWPKAGSARVSLAGASVQRSGTASAPVRAGATPVSVAPAAGAAGDRVGEVAVEVLDRAKVSPLWRDGLLVRVAGVRSLAAANAAGGGVAGAAEVSVSYDAFRYAHGGDWASRLRLWQLPACAELTPERAGCAATPLPSVNDAKSSSVSARVPVSAAGTLVALAAGGSGDEGDFAATSLSPSATWSSGGSTGDFTWSYPMRVPPAVGGPAPALSLSYSSSRVDGMSDATNNQPSWIGEGFDFAPGYIERRYVTCGEDMAGSESSAPNNLVKTTDQCWRSDNATMSLNGGGSELVFEAGKGWHSRSEDGSKIEKLTGAGNGDLDGEHWKVTTADGTQYFFGLDDLPGQGSPTNSTNTVPVYGNHPNEPCRATAFADSDCVQAWRWNLDYVVDPRGNTMSYWYEKESNKYATRMTTSETLSYTRASVLTRIDYGTWDRGVGDRSVSPLAQVLFESADRCASSCATHDATRWPDVPWDQECAASATSCDDFSPTFWSTKRLSKVTTRVWDTTVTPVAWQPVDSWTLGHSYPAVGDGSDHAGLWLNSITQAGLVGGPVTMPPVTFEPVSKPNRVLSVHNTSNNRMRIANVVTETGGKIQVTYSLPDCASGNLPSAAHTNTRLCYPVIGPDATDPEGPEVTEWWHKYVVRQVSESDLQVMVDGTDHGAPVQNTFYTYGGSPAWHYADDDGLVKPSRKTWSQFRGFGTVEVRQGDVPSQTLTRTVFLRGMHGDRTAPAGGTRTVTVAASVGSETVYDEDQFAGLVREQVTFNGVDTKPVSKTVNVPWMSPATASRTINGDTVTARFSNTRVSYNATALGVDGQGGWRTTRSESKFSDTYGTPDWTQDDGDIAVTGDEQCITYAYNRNTVKNLIQTVKQVTTTALACGVAPTSTGEMVSDARNYYDGATSPDTAPTVGAVTRVDELKDWTPAGGTVWLTGQQRTFDNFGRTLTSTDVRGHTTTTTYTPASGGPLTRAATSTPDPNGGTAWTGSVDTKPYWGAPVKTTDMNSRVSEVDYDPLGRVSKVWEVGWSKATNPTKPSTEYSYQYAAARDSYPHIVTKTLNAAGNYLTSYQILDAFLRPRQVQAAGVGGGRVVTDTLYDKAGRADVSYAPHSEPGTPSGALWWEPEWSVPALTKTVFDNASRPTEQVFYGTDGVTNLVEKWRTSTRYLGNATTATPPAGAVPTTTLTDADGRVTELRQHTTAQGVNGAYQATTYTHDRKGQLTKVTDPDGNEWTYTFDIKGRQIQAKDPDRGLTTNQYNDYDDLTSTTDATNKTLVYQYDSIGRKIGLYDTTISAATKRAEWVYDQVYGGPKVRGQQTQAIRYEPAGSANAYVTRVVGFSIRYQPTGIGYVIPAVEGTGLISPAWQYGYGYSAFDGSPTSVTYPAIGGLTTEKVTTNYDATTGLPTSLTTNLSDAGTYVAGQQYTVFGEPTITTRKIDGGVYVEDSTEYDLTTRRITTSKVKPETATGTVSQRGYRYDNAGNITAISDTPQVGQTDHQCFTYDVLRRLTSAWTPNAANACGTAPTVGSLGGPAPYWLDWTFDKVGNRLTEVSHATAGNTTRTYTVPTGGANVARPHAATAVTTAAPGQTAVTTRYAYDSAGNMTCRPTGATANTCPPGTNSQALTWDSEGRLATNSTNSQVNVYDADGSRLIRRDSGGTTLYLPGQEIRREGTATTATATRYYDFGGKQVASRTPTALTWLYADHQGTQHTTVDANSQAVTVRRQTPYGGPRGTQPVWPTPKGFVGGDNDPTGLTHLGAREYDPALGRFISVDPIQDLTDPQQWHGYAYSHNSPVTYSDPSGLIDCDFASCGMGGHDNGGTAASGPAGGGKPGGGRKSSDKPTPKKPDGRCKHARSCDPTPEIPINEPTLTPAQWLEMQYNTAVANLGSLEIKNGMMTRYCHYNADICSEMRAESDRQFGKVLLELSGAADAMRCIEGSASGCVWTAVGLIPYAGKAGKGLYALKALDDAAEVADAARFSVAADGTAIDLAAAPSRFPWGTWNAGTVLSSGETVVTVGRRIWGAGTPSVTRNAGKSDAELRAMASRQDAADLLEMYKEAARGIPSNPTAKPRVELVQQVLEAWDRS